MRKRPRPPDFSRLSGEVGSGTRSGSKPGPSSVTRATSSSSPTMTSTRTRLSGSLRLPYSMAFARASVRLTRKLSLSLRPCGWHAAQRCITYSTACSICRRSFGSSRTSSVSIPTRAGGRDGGLHARHRLLPGVRDLEERIELGELEERPQILVQVRQAQLAPLLADLLGEAHQHAQPRGVDVARVREVDHELAIAVLELLQDFLLELL